MRNASDFRDEIFSQKTFYRNTVTYEFHLYQDNEISINQTQISRGRIHTLVHRIYLITALKAKIRKTIYTDTKHPFRLSMSKPILTMGCQILEGPSKKMGAWITSSHHM